MEKKILRKPVPFSVTVSKPNKQLIGNITRNLINPKISLTLGGIHESSFSIPRYLYKDGNQIENPMIDKMKSNYRFEVSYGQFKDLFIIDSVEKAADSDGENININIKSLPYILTRKSIRSWLGIYKDYKPEVPISEEKVVKSAKNISEQVQSDIDKAMENFAQEVEGDFKGDYLKDGLVAKEVIDDLLSSYSRVWKLTYVDPEIASKARSFSFENTNLYEALGQVATAVNGILHFDSYKREIKLYSQKNVGTNKGLRISERKYLKSIGQTLDHSNVITRLHCYGKDGISINSVNPLGTDYIEDFSYYFGDFEQDKDGKVIKHSDWMSDDLIIAIKKYDALLKLTGAQFKNILEQKDAIEKKIDPLDIQLTSAKAKLKAAEQVLDVNQTVESRDEDAVKVSLEEVNKAQIAVDELNYQIAQFKEEIKIFDSEIESIKKLLTQEDNFTNVQLEELDEYIIEHDYSSEEYDEPEDLYVDAYNKIFKDLNTPKETIEINIVNLFGILEQPTEYEKLNLGDKMVIHFERFGVEQEQQILKMDIDPTADEGGIQLTIANTAKLEANEDILADIIASAYGTKQTVDNGKYAWNQISDTRSDVEKLKKNNFDSTKQAVDAGMNQSVTIDHRGLTVTSPDDPLGIVRVINGAIALSADGWNSVGTAITAKGITAEMVVGALLIGQKLIIQSDDSVSYTMDSEGFKILNSALYIKNEKGVGSNGIELSPENGLLITRGDEMFRGFFNATDGIRFQAKKGGQWRDVLNYDPTTSDLNIAGAVNATKFSINGTNALSEDGTKIDANMIDTSAFDIQPLSWKSLPLRTGFTAGKILPQVAQEGSKVYLRGTVKKTPVATMSTPITFAATSPFYGIDVSNNNGSINWSQVSKDSLGIKFMVAKATEGSTFIDSYFKNHIVQAQANGIKGHAYHYMLATSNAAAISEANNFANVLDASGSNFSGYAFLDVEDNVLSGNATTLTGHCMAFLNRMRERGYKNIGIYASRSFYQTRLIASQFPSDMLLWIAAWGGSSAGITCDIWQYSETGRVSGISGGVDMNVGYSSLLLGNSNGGNTSPYPPSVILQSDRNAWDLYVFLLSKGYSKAAAAGVLGNVQGEVGSGMNPNTEQVRGPAYGIVQWDGSAYPLVGKKTWNGREYVQNLMKAAKITEDYTKMPAQAKLLDWCMFNGQWIGAVTPKSVSAFKSESSPSVAARAFELNFERPAASHPERQGWANTWFNKFKNLEIPSGGGGTNPPDPNPEGYIATLDSKYRPAVNQSFRLFPNDSVTVTTDGNVTPVSFTASEIDLSGITLFTK